MLWSRRGFVGAGMGFAAFPAIANTRATTRYRIFRSGDEIGWHTIDAARNGDEITLDIRIEIAVKILGITAYRYELSNKERWRNLMIESVDSTVNDDGDADFCKVRRQGDTLQIEGSGYTGTAPLDAATTSYWSTDFLKRRVWISTQTGKPLSVSVADAGGEQFTTDTGAVNAAKYRVSGDLDVTLYYLNGEWLGSAFDAGGEPAVYQPASTQPALSLLQT